MTESAAIRIDFYTLQGSTILPTRHEDHATHAGDRPAQGGIHDDLSQMRSKQLSGARECCESPSPRPDTPVAASLMLISHYLTEGIKVQGNNIMEGYAAIR